MKLRNQDSISNVRRICPSAGLSQLISDSSQSTEGAGYGEHQKALPQFVFCAINDRFREALESHTDCLANTTVQYDKKVVCGVLERKERLAV